MNVKDRLKQIKSNKGASMIYVLVLMLFLLAVCASVLTAAGANRGYAANQFERARIAALSESVHKSIMYSLQTDSALPSYIMLELYEEWKATGFIAKNYPIPLEANIGGDNVGDAFVWVDDILLTFNSLSFIASNSEPAVYEYDDTESGEKQLYYCDKTACENNMLDFIINKKYNVGIFNPPASICYFCSDPAEMYSPVIYLKYDYDVFSQREPNEVDIREGRMSVVVVIKTSRNKTVRSTSVYAFKDGKISDYDADYEACGCYYYKDHCNVTAVLGSHDPDNLPMKLMDSGIWELIRYDANN